MQENNRIENWRGLANNAKKRTYFNSDPKWKSTHLDKSYDRKLLGILKIGHQPELKAVKVEAQLLSLSNTCAADSLVQIMATAAVDSESFNNFIKLEQKKSFLLELVHYVSTKGISNKAYILRAKMLREIVEPQKLPVGILRLNCKGNAGSLATKLMRNIPSLKEVSRCSSPNCPNRESSTEIPVPTIVISKDKSNNVQSIEQIIPQMQRVDEISPCRNTFKNVSNISRESYFMDSTISQFPICTGARTANTKMSDKFISSTDNVLPTGTCIGFRNSR